LYTGLRPHPGTCAPRPVLRTGQNCRWKSTRANTHLLFADHAHAGSSARDAIRQPLAHVWNIRLSEVKGLIVHEVAGVEADKNTPQSTPLSGD